ncbi:hypothetical protein BHM03_00060468 [Ensete ventricosum]|nr:hypothetical protein BHM03_00060468 [Ensete ventricosum]
MTNLITQLADYSLLRRRSRMPRVLIIDVAILRYKSRMPGLLVIDAATMRHGSRMPMLLETVVASWIVIRRFLCRLCSTLLQHLVGPAVQVVIEGFLERSRYGEEGGFLERSHYRDEGEEQAARRSERWPLEVLSAEMLLWLGSSERRHDWLVAERESRVTTMLVGGEEGAGRLRSSSAVWYPTGGSRAGKAK